jgi:hypothetical protein
LFNLCFAGILFPYDNHSTRRTQVRIEIQMKPRKLAETISQRLKERLRMKLGSFAHSVSDIHFILDAKPHGQPPARSALLRINFISGGRLILEARGDTVGQAAAQALNRVRSAVEREMIRRWEWVDNHLPFQKRMRTSRMGMPMPPATSG